MPTLSPQEQACVAEVAAQYDMAPAQLLKAVVAHEHNRGNPFTAYATAHVIGAESAMARDPDWELRLEAREATRRRQIPVNPYRMADGMGITTALALRDLLGCSLDAGSSGGAMFLVHFADASEDDIVAVLKLRNDAYVLPASDNVRRRREATSG